MEAVVAERTSFPPDAVETQLGEPDPRLRLVVHHERDPLVTVLTVGGELDMAGASQLDEAMTAVRADAPDMVLVDLSRLSFLDSSGIRALLRVQAVCEGTGSRLVLRRVPDHVQRLLTLAGVMDRFRFAD
jgi:anti-sigma B factor antagonist